MFCMMRLWWSGLKLTRVHAGVGRGGSIRYRRIGMGNQITAQEARELLSYDPNSGKFTWKVSKSSRAISGNIAGCKTGRYETISINGTKYRSNRLAWLFYYGEWPKNVVDHIDGDPSNNKIANLRDVSQAENVRNKTKPYVGSLVPYIGVTISKGKFRAMIGVGRKNKCLGRYNTAEEASEAYQKAKSEIHGEKNEK